MRRLTLNVLLSFAQFEREVTPERIRDKIAASKKKGLWMGGTLPLGYDSPPDPQRRELVVNASEALTVQHLFQLYVNLAISGWSKWRLRNWACARRHTPPQPVISAVQIRSPAASCPFC